MLRVGAWLPEYSHSFEQDGVTFFVTTEGRMGMGYRLPGFDAEATVGPLAFDSIFSGIQSLVNRVGASVSVRVVHRAQISHKNDMGTRAGAMKELGFASSETYVLVEALARFSLGPLDALLRLKSGVTRSMESEAQSILRSFDHAYLKELGAIPLSTNELKVFFEPMAAVGVNERSSLETGAHSVGVIRLWRQSTEQLSEDTLAVLRENLPKPYEINVRFRKLSDVKSQYILQRKRSQLAASNDRSLVGSLTKMTEATTATTQEGAGLVEMEWLLVLRRYSPEALKVDERTVERILKPLGDCMIETFGRMKSYVSSFTGTPMHRGFLELDKIAPYYLPLFLRGEPESSGMRETHKRVTAFHRRDESLYGFDLWRKGYEGANCIINGRRGLGKSVTGNLMSQSILSAPDTCLIKVDVGSSYVKECELAGGEHIQMNLSEPSGLNPFSLLTETEHEYDAAIILSGFLSTLLLESREVELTKEMLGDVERSVLAYAKTKPINPSITDFMAQVDQLPRRGLLERFCEGGVFANVLKPIPNRARLGDSRYTYFNFERLQNAANEDFAQAVMAAVIASVNMQVLKAGDARRGAKQRVIFFADEIPFFIQRNGRFFKLTTANFRKFGHATILIAQTTQDFVLSKADGSRDYGILTNSPIRFFFQVDDEPKVFQERFGLSAEQVLTIQCLGRGGVGGIPYREVFLQDELGGRVLRVRMLKEEYWRTTSSREDNEKLYSLMKAVPGLTLQEGIACLSRV